MDTINRGLPIQVKNTGGRGFNPPLTKQIDRLSPLQLSDKSDWASDVPDGKSGMREHRADSHALCRRVRRFPPAKSGSTVRRGALAWSHFRFDGIETGL